jgi:ribosomal protein RSM22 (predicted rRNA methylase)
VASLSDAASATQAGEPLVITDFGSGPLTLPIALWMSMPSLRDKNIEFRCYDINRHILKTGEELFARISGGNAGRSRVNWKIKTIASSLMEARCEKKSALVTAVNVYNELYWKLNAADMDSLVSFADGEAARLSSFCADDGAVLIVEPGIPRSGTFIAYIRERFIERGFSLCAPCTHHADCPMETSKIQRRSAKWCHFTFSTHEAPESLLNLSRTAFLPKERGVLSFLLAHKGRKENEQKNPGSNHANLPVRIISDPFPLPDSRHARYGCSEKGLVLLTGNREKIAARRSGSLVSVRITGTKPHDKKSGAIVVSD